MDDAFRKFTAKTITKKGGKACDFTYDKQHDRKTRLVYAEDYSIALTDGDVISTEISYRSLTAPAKKGTHAGDLHVYCNGKEIKTVKLVTSKPIRELSAFEKIKYKLRELL